MSRLNRNALCTLMPTFLACYDYGQGAVWLLLDAETHNDAQAAYPGLVVYESRPQWMAQTEETEFRARCERTGFRWNTTDPPTGWLKQYAEG
jgi:hypothetical protein